MTIRRCRMLSIFPAAATQWLLAGLAAGFVIAAAASPQAVPAPAAPAAPAAGTATPSATPGATLDGRIQDLQGEALQLNRELMVLEEELLFPANTQVAVFVSRHPHKGCTTFAGVIGCAVVG